MAYISQTLRLRGRANPEATHPSNNVGSVNGIPYQVEPNVQNSANDKPQRDYESCANQKGIRTRCSAVKESSPKRCERCMRRGLLCEYIPAVLASGRRPQPPPVLTMARHTPRLSDQNYDQFNLAHLALQNTNPTDHGIHRLPHFNTVNSGRGYSHPVVPSGSRSSKSDFGFPAGEPKGVYIQPATHDPSAGFLGPQPTYAMYQPNIDPGLGIFVPAACRYYNPV
ncbi:hypothetical protein C8R44DRAFT_736081 [Mycena epipterygia]|nr:hypothetical protein C8R44DRAFT_736081 [Mycena epipterygia]